MQVIKKTVRTQEVTFNFVLYEYQEQQMNSDITTCTQYMCPSNSNKMNTKSYIKQRKGLCEWKNTKYGLLR